MVVVGVDALHPMVENLAVVVVVVSLKQCRSQENLVVVAVVVKHNRSHEGISVKIVLPKPRARASVSCCSYGTT